MDVLRRVIEYRSRSTKFTIKPLFDLHIGSRLTDEDLLRQDIAAIKRDKTAYWIGGGDYCEFINVHDRRFRPGRLPGWMLDKIDAGWDDLARIQIDRVVEMLTPIREKCLALVKGNHESYIEQHYGYSPYYELCQALRVGNARRDRLDIGIEGFLQLTFRRRVGDEKASSWQMTIYLHHGYGGGRLPGGHALALGRLPTSYQADLYLMGHRHAIQILSQARLGVGTNGGVRQFDTIAALCGTYRAARAKGEEDYGEERGLPPHPVGSPTIIITPDRKRINIMQ